jgi:hypothetical protein
MPSGERASPYGISPGAERAHVLEALDRCRWTVEGSGQAADHFGLNPSTRRYRMRTLGVKHPPRWSGPRYTLLQDDCAALVGRFTDAPSPDTRPMSRRSSRSGAVSGPGLRRAPFWRPSYSAWAAPTSRAGWRRAERACGRTHASAMASSEDRPAWPLGGPMSGLPGGLPQRRETQSYWYALRIRSISLGPHAIVPVSKTAFPSTARA